MVALPRMAPYAAGGSKAAVGSAMGGYRWSPEFWFKCELCAGARVERVSLRHLYAVAADGVAFDTALLAAPLWRAFGMKGIAPERV